MKQNKEASQKHKKSVVTSSYKHRETLILIQHGQNTLFCYSFGLFKQGDKTTTK